MVAFSDSFVGRLQENQCMRYNQVMQALNMSAALTARKTKEFRSPLQEQVINYCDGVKNNLFFCDRAVYNKFKY